MTTSNKFDSLDPRSRRPECVLSEDMLADALDGTLTAAHQQWLDRHTATCAECAAMLADSQRGAAWLDMLKLTRPEPSAELFTRIMAQTSGLASGLLTDADTLPEAGPIAVPHLIQPAAGAWLSPISPIQGPADIPANLLSFPAPYRGPVSRSAAFNRMFANPRLAMTAAMAFFSIALTMNLTGVRLNEMHASDLNPNLLRRGFYQARAGAVRQYDSLHVVQVLESRVDDLRDANAATESTQSTPSQPGKQQQDTPAHTQRESMETRRAPAANTISLNTSAPADERVLSTGTAGISLPYSGGI